MGSKDSDQTDLDDAQPYPIHNHFVGFVMQQLSGSTIIVSLHCSALVKLETDMTRVMRFWCLKHVQVGKTQMSLSANKQSLLLMYTDQWPSQNADKVTHIKGRLLDQTVILFNCVPFQDGNFS